MTLKSLFYIKIKHLYLTILDIFVKYKFEHYEKTNFTT